MLRRTLLLLAGLLAIGLLVVGWYAANRGFTQKWRRFVALEFHKRGVELSLNRLTLEPFRGIIAKQVRIYDKGDHRRIIAFVDEVRLVINFANLFQGHTFIDALDLRDANVAVPLNPSKSNGTKLEISHLSGLLFLPPQQIYLSRLEADFYGMHLRASGRLINPRRISFFEGSDDAALEKRTEWIENFIAEMKRLRFPGNTPQLDLRFSGDLANVGTLSVEATLWAEKVARENYALSNFYLNASLRDGIVRLRELSASDAVGVIRATGDYDVQTHASALQFRSTLDAPALARSLTRVPALEEAVFYAPPDLSVALHSSPAEDTAFQMLGHIALKTFSYRGVAFDGLNADFSSDGTRWSALDLNLAHRTGRLSGNAMHADGQDRSSLKSTIQRKVLAPLFTGAASGWMAKIDFIESASAQAIPHPTLAEKTR